MYYKMLFFSLQVFEPEMHKSWVQNFIGFEKPENPDLEKV